MPSSAGRSSRIGSSADASRYTRTPLPVPDPSPGADVLITVATGTVVATSQMEPGVSWVSSNPVSFGLAGWPNVKTNGLPMFGAQSTHIFPFGLEDPWGPSTGGSYQTVPSNPAPTADLNLGLTTQNWTLNGAFTQMASFSSGGAKHMKMYGGEWWEKHMVSTGTVITQFTAADAFSDKGRVKNSRLPDWLYKVRTAAKLAMTYGVRWFSIWNELKGYLDNGAPDVSMNSGAGDTPMGYSYFYKKTSEEILLAQADLKTLYDSTGGAQGVNVLNSDIKIGGPYTTIRGRSTTTSAVAASNPYAAYLYNRPWGYMDSGNYNALEGFLTNVASNGLRLDFLSVDGADYNKGIASDGSAVPSDWPAVDDWANGQRWHDWHQYFAATLSAHGLGSKPIIWDEYYRYAVKTIFANSATRDSYDAALCADFYRYCVLDGVKWPFAWSPWSITFNGSRVGELLTSATTSAGGQPTPYGNVAALFKTHFAPGTSVYGATLQHDDGTGTLVPDTTMLAIANATTCIVINKSNAVQTVSVNSGAIHTMQPYEVAAYTY